MRKRFAFASALLSVGLLATACGSTPERSESGDGATGEFPSVIELDNNFDPSKSFRFAYSLGASSWDPTTSSSGADLIFWGPVYDRLLRISPDGEIEPMLATEFTPSDDLTSITLTLREGLTFSDGAPFDAEAVKFNLDRNRGSESKIANEIAQISSVEVIDPLTVQINVADDLGALAGALTGRPGVMVSPQAATSGALTAGPVGIGPFVVTSTVPGDRTEYAKSEAYWDADAQRVDAMTYLTIADDQTRYNALASGELDGALVNGEQIAAAEDDGFQAIAKPTVNFLHMAVNTADGPLGDPDVLKALNMLVDREGISKGLYDGFCTPSVQPFPPGDIAYNKEIGDGLDQYPYDPEAAKELLEGKALDGLSITLAAPNVTIYTKLAEILQSELAEVGVDVTVSPVPAFQLVTDFAVDKNAEAIASIYSGANDPNIFVQRYLAADASMNPGGAQYADILAAADAAADPMDSSERSAKYDEMMEAWMEAPPHVISICNVHLAAAFAENVSGVAQPMAGAVDLRGVAVS